MRRTALDTRSQNAHTGNPPSSRGASIRDTGPANQPRPQFGSRPHALGVCVSVRRADIPDAVGKKIRILTHWPHQESFMQHIIFCVTDRCIFQVYCQSRHSLTAPQWRSSNTAIPTVARLQTSFTTLLARSHAANLKGSSRIRNGQTELDGAPVTTSSRCHAVSRQPPGPSICLGSGRWHAETRA